MSAQVVESALHMTSKHQVRTRRRLRQFGDWVRRHYGLREIIVPEKYLVGRRHDVVVTYSSCLALVYFAEDPERLTRSDIMGERHRRHLHDCAAGASGHRPRRDAGRRRRARAQPERARAAQRRGGCGAGGHNPLDVYGTERYSVRAVEALVRQPNAGDLVLFGSFDGYEIVSFDDQVGAHGSAGGPQVYPFLVTPPSLDVADACLEDARDINRVIMRRYLAPEVPVPSHDPPARSAVPADRAVGPDGRRPPLRPGSSWCSASARSAAPASWTGRCPGAG